MLFYNIKQHFKLLNPAINYHVTSLSHQYHLPQNKFFYILLYYNKFNYTCCPMGQSKFVRFSIEGRGSRRFDEQRTDQRSIFDRC